MVIGCCNSRVSPEVIFDAGPGELFVVRNVANLVPPYAPDGTYHGVSAALEFAVEVLERAATSSCWATLAAAACKAFAEKPAPGDFIGKWMSLSGARRRVHQPHAGGAGQLPHAAGAGLDVLRSLENLKTFPFVRAACERGRLTLHGAYFDVASGELSTLDPDLGRHIAVAQRRRDRRDYAALLLRLRSACG